MASGFLKVEQSPCLQGQTELVGAKNAVLVIMASLLLTSGKSRLKNVPHSYDVLQMIELLRSLGAHVVSDAKNHSIEVDTTHVNKWQVSSTIMKKMRASVLVMGPLLARFARAHLALPGGDVIGSRPIDYHLKNFSSMGVKFDMDDDFFVAHVDALKSARLVLEYPSVGATENILMAATLTKGTTTIINAALEPEVFNLIDILKKMGARITVHAPATIVVEGVSDLLPVEHDIIMDRLEAGTLLLAVAATGGQIDLPQAPAHFLDLVLYKLEQMGHTITIGPNGVGISLKATQSPRAVSFKTGPYPGFPTDLQAPMMALQCIASGTSVIEETVFENRFQHARELEKMGASIKIEHNKAIITGVEQLYGTQVIASDIRACAALVIAGLVAKGTTTISGIHHWKRGYDALEKKLARLGGIITLHDDEEKIVVAREVSAPEEQSLM